MSDILNANQNLHAMAPSNDFRSTVDTTRLTKAIYYGPDTGADITVRNEVTESDVVIKAEGFILPVRTKTAVTVSGYSVVYLY